MKVEFQIITGYGNYCISNHGAVRNLKTGKLLKHQYRTDGYPYVDLYKDGEGRKFYVHILVASHFLGPAPENHIVHHIDHDKDNPVVSNLEYVTQSENIKKWYESKERLNK